MTAVAGAGAAVAVLVGLLTVRPLVRRPGGGAARRRLGGPVVAAPPVPAGPAPAVVTVPRVVAVALERAGCPWPAFDVWRAWLFALVAATTSAFVTGGAGLAVVAAAAVAGGPAGVLWLLRDRAARRVEEELPGALDTIASSLRSGGSLHQAVTAAARTTPGHLGRDLQRVAVRAAAGAPLSGALEAWAVERPAPAVGLAVAALVTGADAGGPHARSLDGVAATLRDRVAVRRELRALSSQARLSAVVIAVAPPAFGVLTAATDPAALRFLLGTPPGLACLVAGLCLDAVAVAWMARLTAAAA